MMVPASTKGTMAAKSPTKNRTTEVTNSKTNRRYFNIAVLTTV